MARRAAPRRGLPDRGLLCRLRRPFAAGSDARFAHSRRARRRAAIAHAVRGADHPQPGAAPGHATAARRTTVADPATSLPAYRPVLVCPTAPLVPRPPHAGQVLL